MQRILHEDPEPSLLFDARTSQERSKVTIDTLTIEAVTHDDLCLL